MATNTHTTRRTVIATLAGAGALAIPSLPAAASPPFSPRPSALGRRYLRYLALIRFMWRAKGGEIDDEDTGSWVCLDRWHGVLEQTRAEILARPVTGVADIMDRLVLIGHEADHGEIQHRNVWPVLAGALTAAGINPAECCEDYKLSANAYAGA